MVYTSIPIRSRFNLLQQQQQQQQQQQYIQQQQRQQEQEKMWGLYNQNQRTATQFSNQTPLPEPNTGTTPTTAQQQIIVQAQRSLFYTSCNVSRPSLSYQQHGPIGNGNSPSPLFLTTPTPIP